MKKVQTFIILLAAIVWASCSNANSAATEKDSILTTLPAAYSDTKSSETAKENWDYKTDEDKMDGTKMYFATCASTNLLEFDFPYNGGSSMYLLVRNMNNKNEVVISISKGQFTSLYNDNYIRIKYDSSKPVVYRFTTAADGSSDYIFPAESAAIISKLKRAKHVMIEAPFYREGRQQGEFDVAGLSWVR